MFPIDKLNVYTIYLEITWRFLIIDDYFIYRS